MPTFQRGAKPSPRHVLAAAIPYQVLTAPAPQFGVVPPKLDMWGNDTDGDCVTAEEAFAKAWWSAYCGLPETFATAGEVLSWARAHGWANGAYLTEVMDAMIREGMKIGGKAYADGKYSSVDYSNELVLRAALDATDGTGGPVKIGIDADALPKGAGNQQGWYATSGGRFPNTDHCVAVAGYGRADYLYDLLGVARPSALSASQPGYLLYTWSTIGFVSHDWLMGTTTEAWVRNPTTPGQSPVGPPTPPAPPVPPPPVPPTPGGNAIAGLGMSLAIGNWSNGITVGSIAQLAGTAKITVTRPIALPRELSGLAIPTVILFLLQEFRTIALPIILIDLAAGKNWGQIATDVILRLLGKSAGDVAGRRAVA